MALAEEAALKTRPAARRRVRHFFMKSTSCGPGPNGCPRFFRKTLRERLIPSVGSGKGKVYENMKKIDIKKLIFYILITYLIGVLPSIFVFKNMSTYNTLNKPPLSPPSIVFPIAWSILYLLMGISIYIIMQSKRKLKKNARLIYYIQLVTNALWTPIFFGFKEYFLAFLWILMLIVFVITMILTFYKISKKAAYIQIPYLLWLLFASYLNFGVFVLN